MWLRPYVCVARARSLDFLQLGNDSLITLKALPGLVGFNLRTRLGALFPQGGNVSLPRLWEPEEPTPPKQEMVHETSLGIEKGKQC